MEYLTCRHSYAGGDLVSLLPGLRHVHKETGKKWIIYQRIDFELFYYEGMIPATVNSEGKAVSMNRKHFDMLKPLLLAQDYIEDFREWKGEKCDIDMDKSRDSRSIPMPYVSLHQLPFLIAPELQCDLSEPWLNVSKGRDLYFNKVPNVQDLVIVNRTQRYTNPNIHYYFLKQYEQNLIFSGTPTEHEVFCKQWGLDIPYLQINDFLELSVYLQRCRFFLGNQSCLWHICNAIGKNRILEVCGVFPNTWSTTKGGYHYIFQEAAEVLFYKMFNNV